MMTDSPTRNVSVGASTPGRAFLGVLLPSLWLLVAVSGSAALWTYDDAPGTGANPPATWPRPSTLSHEAGLPTLIVFAHPHCPCTRATLTELARLMAALHGRVTAHVVLWQSDRAPQDWEHTEVSETAAGIPGVDVISDVGGAEALRFGALTSGETVVYDADGRLRFHGGITVSRGHEGDSLGRAAILALVTEGAAGRTQTPVFGCHIRVATES